MRCWWKGLVVLAEESVEVYNSKNEKMGEMEISGDKKRDLLTRSVYVHQRELQVL